MVHALIEGDYIWIKKGYSKFSLNLIESVKNIWLDVMHTAQHIETSSNISLWKSTYEALKRLRNENPSNGYTNYNIWIKPAKRKMASGISLLTFCSKCNLFS